MPSNDLKGDAMSAFAKHRDTIVAAGGVGILLLFLLLLFGGLNVVGGLLFVGYALVWLTVLAFVLWLFYRLVTAVERIAAAQERMASTRGAEPTTAAAETTASEPAGDDDSPAAAETDDDSAV